MWHRQLLLCLALGCGDATITRDAAPTDGGDDAGAADVGEESGVRDAASDSPHDGGTDVGTDTGPDAEGIDVGIDALITDAGADVGNDVGADAGPDNIVFRSGFEGVSLDLDPVAVRGRDSVTGYSWDTDIAALPGLSRINNQTEGVVEYTLAQTPHPVTGEMGNRVMRYRMPRQPATEGKFRASLKLFLDAGHNAGFTIFTRALMRIGANVTAHPPFRFFNMYEFRERTAGNPDALGWSLKVYHPEGSSVLHFLAHSRNISDLTERWDEASTVEVPVDEWFYLDTFFRRHDTNGEVYWAIQRIGGEREVIVHRRDIDTISTPDSELLTVAPMKFYFHNDYRDVEMQMEYDDFEIRGEYPPGYFE